MQIREQSSAGEFQFETVAFLGSARRTNFCFNAATGHIRAAPQDVAMPGNAQNYGSAQKELQ